MYFTLNFHVKVLIKLENEVDGAESDKAEGGKNKITANALMTTLLDNYVETYAQRLFEKQNQFRAMRAYLRHQAKLILNTDDDTLLYRIFQDGYRNGEADVDFQYSLQFFDGMKGLCESFHYEKMGDWSGKVASNEHPSYELHDEMFEEIYCVSIDDEEANQYIPDDYSSPYGYGNIWQRS